MIEKIFSHATQRGYFLYESETFKPYWCVLLATGNLSSGEPFGEDGMIEVIVVWPKPMQQRALLVSTKCCLKIITREETEELILAGVMSGDYPGVAILR